MKATILLFVIFASLTFLSQHVNGDDKKDKQKKAKEAERQIDFKFNNNHVSLDSTTKDGTDKNRFTIDLNGEKKIELDLRSFTKTDNSSTLFRFRIRFISVFEYVEKGIAGSGYSKTTDQKGNEYTIGENKREVEFTNNGKKDSTFVFFGATKDNSFVLNCSMGSLPFNVTGGKKKILQVDPSSLKMDVIVKNFNYTLNDSRLAIKARVISKFETSTTSATSKDIALGSSATPRGFFSWDEFATATVNGVDNDVAVIVSPLEKDEDADAKSDDPDEVTKFAFYSFDAVHPSKLFWDPEMGMDTFDADVVDTNSTSSTSSTGSTVSTGSTGSVRTSSGNKITASLSLFGIFICAFFTLY